MKIRSAFLAVALAASSLAWAESYERPERVARLSYVEGELRFNGATEPATSALPDRPLLPGDRMETPRGGRVELTFGTAVMRLDEQSELSISRLDADTVRVELTSGVASLHVRELYEDEAFELVTPNTTIAFRTSGEYRVNIAPSGATELIVRAGSAEVATAGGPVRVADGQQVWLEGHDAAASLVTLQPADAFDDWVLEREVQLAQAEPPPGADEGYSEEALDEYGEWYDDPGYGRVWMPSYAYGGYDPFYYGYWQHTGYGYSWYDPMPWSYYTFHSGHWTYLDHLNRWCWVPARPEHHRLANDTHPFGRLAAASRLDDGRRNSRMDNGTQRDDDAAPVARSSGRSRLSDADRMPEVRRDSDSGSKSRGGTIVPRLDRNQGSSGQLASASKSLGSSSKSTQSSNSSSSRRSSTSSTLAPKYSGAVSKP